MASQYLKAQFKSILLPDKPKKLIKQRLKLSNFKTQKEIKLQILAIPKPKNLKLKPRSSEKSSESPTKFNQRNYLSVFSEKQKESQEFTNRLWKDKRKRQKAQAKRQEREQLIKIYELEQEQREKELENAYKQMKKEDRLRKNFNKSNDRKSSFSYLKEIQKHEYKKVKSLTPLFKKIESSFVANYEIPELEKRKEILKQKHEFFKPMDHNSIISHSKIVHFKKLSSSEYKKNPSVYSENSSPFTKSRIIERLLEEDEKVKKAEKESKKIKLDLLDKKKKYSEIVKEVFTPSLDVLKQKEIEMIKAKLENPVPKRTFLRILSESPSNLHPNSASAHRKSKNLLIHKDKKKAPSKGKDIFVKDYIKEMRQARERSFSTKNLLHNDPASHLDISNVKNNKFFKRKIKNLDKAAQEEESKISYLSPYDSKSLKISEHVNDLLVTSIRAKIAILDNIN